VKSPVEKFKLRIDIIMYVLSRLRKCGKTKLMKLLYLIDREFSHRGFEPLFDWVLWWYGPFSKDVLTILDVLEMYGLVRSEYRKNMKVYITDIKEHIISDKSIREVIDSVINEWGFRKLEELLRYVYELPEVRKARPLSKIDIQ